MISSKDFNKNVAPWIWLLGLLAFVVIGAIIAGALVRENNYNEDCTLESASTEFTPASEPPANTDIEEPSLAPDQSTELKFGRRSGAKSLTLELNNPAQRAIETQVIDDFQREDGAKFDLGTDNITATLESIDKNGTLLALRICADRTKAEADSGSYEGAVILQTEESAVRVPVTLELSDTHVRIVLPSYIAATIIFGSLYTSALSHSYAANDRVLSTAGVRSYLEWWRTIGGIIAVVAGMAAALAVMSAQYLRADVWGDELWDAFALVGSMFVAFIGAATVARIPGGKATETEPVPDLRQKTIDEAASVLGTTTLKLKSPPGSTGTDTIATQNPEPGTSVSVGTEVDVGI